MTHFYPRGASDARVIAIIACLSVCVCLCVTRQYCIKTAKRRITQTTPRDSPGTLVFFLMPKFVGGRPLPPEICAQSDPPPFKQQSAIMEHFLWGCKSAAICCWITNILYFPQFPLSCQNLALRIFIRFELPYMNVDALGWSLASCRIINNFSISRLHFFTFIFTVLLPVLSRLLIMSINTTFFDFSRWRPSAI